MKATYVASRPETEQVTTFWFESHDTFNFTAGQYTELYLEHDSTDSRGKKRWFTISSSPTSLPRFSITTRVGNSISSYKERLKTLVVQEELDFAEPMGDFVLPILLQTPIVFVALDMGITPFHSILTWLKDTGEKRNIRLFYEVPTEDDLMFQTLFQDIKVEPVYVVNSPTDAWGGEMGKISADVVIGVDQPDEETLFYLSGPRKRLSLLSNDLGRKGIKKHQIILDEFPGYD